MSTDGPARAEASEQPVRHDFAFTPAYRVAGLLLGVTPRTAWVEVGPDGLVVRYGLWRLSTPLANLGEATLTGGFGFLKTAGPPHLSFSDRGISFTTNGRAALCLAFHEPVRGIEPTGLITHPGATLSVADPQALLADVRRLVPGIGLAPPQEVPQ